MALVLVEFPEDFLKTLIKHCRRETNLDGMPDPISQENFIVRAVCNGFGVLDYGLYHCHLQAQI